MFVCLKNESELWDEYPTAMIAVQDKYLQIMRRTVKRNHCYEVKQVFPSFPSLHRKFGDERCHMNTDMIPWQPPRALCIFDVSLYWAQQCGAMLCCNAMPGEGGGAWAGWNKPDKGSADIPARRKGLAACAVSRSSHSFLGVYLCTQEQGS